MIGPILDWFRGRKGEIAGPLGAQKSTPESTLAQTDTSAADFDTQVLIQGSLGDLKRIVQTLAQRSIDSQIIVPPSGCNT